ncbi:MAG: hypothetical protein WC547_07450 [Candidatus Omnitrophota bacterium]
MKKEHMQLTVIGVGLPVLAFFLVTNLKPVMKRPAVSGVPAVVSADAGMAALPVNVRVSGKVAALQAKRWEAEWGRDPFLPVSDRTGTLSELKLKGISFSPDKKGYAFINDQIVSAGDTLGGYEVSRIEKDRVMLMRGTQTFFLTFYEDK